MELSVRRSSSGQDDQSWLGSAHGTQATQTITIDTTTFTDPATQMIDGWLKSGLPLQVLRQEFGQNVYGLWLTTTTLAGFLFSTVEASADLVGGAILEHGRVRTAKLPVPVDPGGRTSAAGRIIFA